MRDAELRGLERRALATKHVDDVDAYLVAVARRLDCSAHSIDPRKLFVGEPDPRDHAEFRDACARVGRFEEIRAWVVGQAIEVNKAFVRKREGGSFWADRCRAIVGRILDLTREWPDKEQRRAFRDAYPFGERALWPYKAWLRAIARATGRKPSGKARAKSAPNDSTRSLFE